MVLAQHVVEIHVGSLGEALKIAQGAAQLEEKVVVRVGQAGPVDDGVGQAGVAQLDVPAGDLLPADHSGAVQVDHGGVVQADAILAAVDALADDQARGRLHLLDRAGQTRLIAIAADAAGTVAAHLAHGAVAVEEQHAEVSLALGLVHDHEAVGPQGAVGGAEGLGDAGEGFGGQALLQVVEDDEVVAGSVHFPEFHGVVSLSAGRRGLRPLQIKIKRSVVPAS